MAENKTGAVAEVAGGQIKQPQTGSERMLQWFSYDHLPENDLREASKLCSTLAHKMCEVLPGESPEKTAGLRKLLEAKDCFVRAALDQ